MKMTKFFLIFYCLIAILAIESNCQTKDFVKPWNTMTLLYIDNSEGFDNDPLNAPLNNEVKDELKKKLNAIINKPDNNFFLLASNGADSWQSSDLQMLLQSERFKKYLAKSSKEAEYALEKREIRENFSEYPIRIKKSVDVYLCLSGFALNQVSKKTEELPTPLFLPKEIPIYLNNKDLTVHIYLYSNKEAIEKLTLEKVRNYFTFCNPEINLSNVDFEILPF